MTRNFLLATEPRFHPIGGPRLRMIAPVRTTPLRARRSSMRGQELGRDRRASSQSCASTPEDGFFDRNWKPNEIEGAKCSLSKRHSARLCLNLL